MNVLAHVLLYNSGPEVARCIESLCGQEGFESGRNLVVEVTDNGSAQSPIPDLCERFGSAIAAYQNASNLGFCGGHNQAVARFLRSEARYLFIVNPDVRLEPATLRRLVEALAKEKNAGFATPLLLRANERLEPLQPPVIDAAGMTLTPALRHFDRGAGEAWRNQFSEPEKVFGGTGACLLCSREAVLDLLLEAPQRERDVELLFPQLAANRGERKLLFDEGFFAYREDADLAWRANKLGWKTVFVPAAVAYHVRRVTPERRRELPADLNRHSVRNRFLLQLNNYSIRENLLGFFGGILFRNAAVVLGVLFRERASFAAFRETAILFRRAVERRRVIAEKARARLI